MRGFIDDKPNRAHVLNLHQASYLDDLMRDMGLKTARKAPVLDAIVPYFAADFRSLN